MNNTLVLITTSIATSIIAAIIFWFFFNFYPQRAKYNKIRPKLEYDIYEIYSSLFQYIQIPFIPNMYSPAFDQAKIYAGLKRLDDFELALYTKCLDESFKSVDSMASNLLNVGIVLDDISYKICNQAQQLYLFNTYLTLKEILLLRKITVKLKTYSYVDNANIKCGNQILHPVNPTISYMSKNFYQLYLLFVELQEIVLKFKRIDDTIKDDTVNNLSRRRIMNCCYRGEYSDCLKIIKKCSNKGFLWEYKFISLYNINKEKALNVLKEYLPKTYLQLISLRGIFMDNYKDEIIKTALIKIRSENEYIEMANCIKSEGETYRRLISQAVAIREYYKSKINNQFLFKRNNT